MPVTVSPTDVSITILACGYIRQPCFNPLPALAELIISTTARGPSLSLPISLPEIKAGGWETSVLIGVAVVMETQEAVAMTTKEKGRCKPRGERHSRILRKRPGSTKENIAFKTDHE